MVLQDSILEQMAIQDYFAATKPKVYGSWNLHWAFEGSQLRFFVMLSSLASILGQASQSNYSAGGISEDALVNYHNSQGLPAASVSDSMIKSGHTLLSEEDVLEVIEFAIVSPQCGWIMLGLNRGRGAHWQETAMGRDMRFALLRYRRVTQSVAISNPGGPSHIAAKIAQASDFEETVDTVVQGMSKNLMDVLMLPEDRIDATKVFSEYGADSLVAVELLNMLSLRTGAELSVFAIIQRPSISMLGSMVAAKSSHLDTTLLPS
ncbi:hypothetical protein AAE478_010066 [Parahypoxylon ruwenzoriense]